MLGFDQLWPRRSGAKALGFVEHGSDLLKATEEVNGDGAARSQGRWRSPCNGSRRRASISPSLLLAAEERSTWLVTLVEVGGSSGILSMSRRRRQSGYAQESFSSRYGTVDAQ